MNNEEFLNKLNELAQNDNVDYIVIPRSKYDEIMYLGMKFDFEIKRGNVFKVVYKINSNWYDGK